MNEKIPQVCDFYYSLVFTLFLQLYLAVGIIVTLHYFLMLFLLIFILFYFRIYLAMWIRNISRRRFFPFSSTEYQVSCDLLSVGGVADPDSDERLRFDPDSQQRRRVQYLYISYAMLNGLT
jgi:hypothetical protein